MQYRLILIRHGESVLGSEGRYSGNTDTPLTPKGRRQILRLRRRFNRSRVHHIYSSDLSRCRATAEILADGKPITFTRKLRELNFGKWEGCTHRQLLRREPNRYRKWIADPRSVSPPEGETLVRLAARVRSFARDLVRRHPRKTVALVTHGGPMRVLLAGRLREFWSVDVPPASMHSLVFPEVAS
jgi:broad specificity phosphatase PhoE